MNPMYITFAIYLVAVLLIGLAAYFQHETSTTTSSAAAAWARS